AVARDELSRLLKRKTWRNKQVLQLVLVEPVLQLVLDMAAHAVKFGIVAHETGCPLPAREHALMREPQACSSSLSAGEQNASVDQCIDETLRRIVGSGLFQRHGADGEGGRAVHVTRGECELT